MRNQAIDVTLSSDEWAFISALRGLPESPLKARVGTLLGQIVAFMEEPRCAEMQGDGVPCTTVTAQCEQCIHVAELIDRTARLALERARAAERAAVDAPLEC